MVYNTWDYFLTSFIVWYSKDYNAYEMLFISVIRLADGRYVLCWVRQN
jgi:hypothetical protein